jgi:predicted short-subunit dehydrogenase-like oxidoreductase (DUF2520 family)
MKHCRSTKKRQGWHLKTIRWHIAIIGAGKVGTVLGKVLAENGEKIVCVCSRTKRSARAGGRFIGCQRVTTDLGELPARTDLVMITTPHDVVADVAQKLAGLTGFDFRGKSVCHVSGMLTAAVLDPLRERGATVFSFHPLQTFPRAFRGRDIVPVARGIYYGVDALPRGMRVARALARKLEGRVLPVPPEMRAFYHAACVVASNHLTVMLGILETMFHRLRPEGEDFLNVFLPIVQATLRNVHADSPAGALSGPIVRGGVETIARHFDALTRFAPALIPYYARLSLETMRLAVAGGALVPAQVGELARLILPYTDGSLTPEDSR